MLFLAAATDKLQLVTSAAVATDVHVSYADNATGTITEGRQNTAITTATTTDILAAPAANTIRKVKLATIRNKGAADQAVTVVFDQAGTDYELRKVVLKPDDTLQYIEGIGFLTLEASPLAERATNAATAEQTGFATDTYVTNSWLAIPSSSVRVSSIISWYLVASKTAAGTAAPAYNIRIGPNRSTADTARLAISGPSQTAASDVARIRLRATIWSVGVSGVLVAYGDIFHNSTSTGFASTLLGASGDISAGFDNTALGGQYIGLSINAGASAAWTLHQVQAEADW